MLKSFMLSALSVLSIHALAQHSVSGVVRSEKDNNVLINATVQLKGTSKFAVTDDLGFFQLDKVPDGSQSLYVQYLGYHDVTFEISISTDTAVLIIMKEDPMLTDEVVVEATRATQKNGVTYSTVSKSQIQKQNFGQDLPMLLNWTPSVVTTSDAGAGVGYTGIRIRGSDATRVNVTINGIPYNDSESLGTYWVDIPDMATSTQSIQIQRGVGTSTNGAGAFGGSINLQTNTLNDKPYAEITSTAGSFGTLKNAVGFGTGLINDHWVVDGRVSKIQSDGFIDRASSDLSSYYFSGGYYAGKTMLKAIVFGGKERTYQSWYGVPESRLNNDEEAMLVTAANEGWNAEQTQNLLTSNSRTFNPYTYKNQVDDYKQDHYQLHFSQRMGEGFTWNTALHYTPGRGYYEEYKYDQNIADYGRDNVVIDDDGVATDNDTLTTTDLIRRRWLDNNFYGVTYSLQYEGEKLNSVLGGAWNRYDGDHFGEILWAQVPIAPYEHRYYFNNGDKRDFNMYFKNSYQFGSLLSAFVDLQVRKLNYKTSGIENKQNTFDVDKQYTFFNPKVGLNFSFSNQQAMYVSYSIANREPVRDDFIDNLGATPKAERLGDLEIGYRATSSTHAFNVTGYLMHYNNQLVLTGAINDVGSSVRTNVDKSYRAGVELEGIMKISKKLSWNVNLTLSQNKIKNFTEVLYDYGANWDEYNVVERKYSNTDISFSPNVIGGSTLTYTVFRGTELALLTKYVGKQYLDNTSNNERSISAYLVNDVRVSYTLNPAFMKELRFSVLVNNITNTLYAANGYSWGYRGGGDEYRENYFFPQAGIHFMAMLSAKF